MPRNVAAPLRQVCEFGNCLNREQKILPVSSCLWFYLKIKVFRWIIILIKKHTPRWKKFDVKTPSSSHRNDPRSRGFKNYCNRIINAVYGRNSAAVSEAFRWQKTRAFTFCTYSVVSNSYDVLLKTKPIYKIIFT